MQKVRIQLCLEQNALTRLEGYRKEFMCKNYNDTIHLLLKKLARMDFVMEQLEQKAVEAKEWKLRAEGGVGTPMIPIIADDANVSTDSKPQSVESIKDTRKRNEAFLKRVNARGAKIIKEHNKKGGA